MDEGTELAVAVGKIVAALREEQGLTLEDLATRSGLHRTAISLIERGERHATVASAANIARALGTTLSDLVMRAESAIQAEAR